MLQLADPNLEYTITCNASDFAVGAMLRQRQEDGDHPVAYESRKMNAVERNYPTHEREQLAVIHSLRTWRYYLVGQKFIIVIDHYSLQYLQTQPNLSKRQARWLKFLAEFDYRMVYQPGKSNVVADTLSQLSVVNCGTTSGGKSGLEMFQGLEQQYQKDEKTKEILQNIGRYPQDIVGTRPPIRTRMTPVMPCQKEQLAGILQNLEFKPGGKLGLKLGTGWTYRPGAYLTESCVIHGV